MLTVTIEIITCTLVKNKWTGIPKMAAPCLVCYSQESERRFTTFHDGKPLEPLVNEKWEDFNVKVNTTLEAVLGKV